MNESEKQFFFTRAAPSTSGRAKNQVPISMNTKLPSLFVMLALLSGVHCTLAQVTNLEITTAGGQFILYWPTSMTNYILQTVTDLSSTNWVKAGQAVSTNWVMAGNAVTGNAVVVMKSTLSGYFRLIQTTTPAGMALIPAGSFTMGDTLDGEIDAIPTNVNVSAFYMDKNLVTYTQWQGVYSWATNHGYVFDNHGSGKATNHPVNTLNWYDMVKWCNARSQQAGLTPVYYTDAGLTQVYTNGDATPYVKWNTPSYRLPTEAEWEKAARGGLSGQRFPWGNTISESQANYQGDTKDYSYDLGPNGYNSLFDTGGGPYSNPVGYFAPNGYGLYDMAGNEWELVWDWYGTPYAGGVNPHGPSTGTARSLRAGDWGSGKAWYARCASRFSTFGPTNVDIAVSFRCVIGF